MNELRRPERGYTTRIPTLRTIQLSANLESRNEPETEKCCDSVNLWIAINLIIQLAIVGVFLTVAGKAMKWF